MEAALNDWLSKIETHINQIEERVFTSVQHCDLEEIERKMSNKLKIQLKDFTE